MGVVGLYLVVQDGLACLYEFILVARAIADLEVDGFLELLWQLEVDDLVFALEGGLKEVLDHCVGLVGGGAVVIWVYLAHSK